MSLVITKETGNFFSLVLDGGEPIISEENRLTTIGNLCNFKTANGANLILKQNILVTEITVIASGTFTFTDVDDLWVKLIEINFFDGTLVLPPSGIDSFDELLDTFTYSGRAGQIVVVRNDELGLTTIAYEIYTTAEKNKLAGIETGAQVNVNPDWNFTDPSDKRTILNKPQDAGIISYGTYSLLGQDLTLSAGWVWRINNTIYSNASPIVINFPYAGSGLQRLDLVVFNTSNSATRIGGFEVVSNPTANPVPVNTVYFSISLVTDSTVGDPSTTFETTSDDVENLSNVSGANVTEALDNLLESIPKEYAQTVYVNNNNPNSATIFDLDNPPLVNDNLLKDDVNNLYIGLDASTWVYNSTTLNYVTEPITTNQSNFLRVGTPFDATGDKTGAIYRYGKVGFGIPNPVSAVHIDGNVRCSSLVTGATNAQVGAFIASENSAPTSASHGFVQVITDSVDWKKGVMIFAVNGVDGTNSLPTEAMRIIANRNIGINNPTPTEKLDVIGNVKMSGNGIGADATALDHFVTLLQLNKHKTELSYACSDEVSDLAVGTLITFRMPIGLTLTAIKLSLNTAPTGTKLIVDVRKNGVTVLSTLISADISSTTSVGASVPYVISVPTLTDDSVITILTTQVGSTVAGKGLKVTLIGNKI